MKVALEIDGTQAEIATILGAFGDAGLRAVIQDFSSTLAVFGQQLEAIMATLQDVLDAAAAEKAQVASKLADLSAQVQALRDQIAAGSAATPEQLDLVLQAITDIFTPDAPTP